MKHVLCALLVVICLPCVLFSQESYEEWLESQSEAADEWTAGQRQAYRDFVKADSLAFAEFREAVERVWDTAEFSTDKDWVEYGDDLASRSKVDFEAGEATVEVLVPEKEAAAEPVRVADALEGAVASLLESRGTSRDYELEGEEPEPLSEEPVLRGQVAGPSGEVVGPEDAGGFAEAVVASKSYTSETVDSKDGVRRVKATVTFRLVPDHLRIRAQRYLPEVREFAEKYGLDVRLVLAMIHTESYFNPKARSPVPAYGLMQLVPASGGRDAYEFVHGEPVAPTPDYLFDPRNNIELGTAYMALVESREFAGVVDPKSRLYCVVSAYNTGARNVCRGLVGRDDRDAAVEAANSMEPEGLFLKLREDLPYEETRDYLGKVVSRMAIYEEWSG